MKNKSSILLQFFCAFERRFQCLQLSNNSCGEQKFKNVSFSVLRGILEYKIQHLFLGVFSVQSSENCPCAAFRDGTFCDAVKSEGQPAD